MSSLLKCVGAISSPIALVPHRLVAITTPRASAFRANLIPRGNRSLHASPARESTINLAKAIPIFAAGRHAAIGRNLQEQLLPDYDVIHLSLSVEEVKRDLPRILRGDAVAPPSGIGSNKDRSADTQRLPKFLVVGGGFSPEEFEHMQLSIDLTGGGRLSGGDIPVWLKRNPRARTALELPGGEITPEVTKFMASTLKARLDEAAKEMGLK
ncbi:hypothetical protein DRE_05257 [Drechslerella stenobrocha 248]|uniref:Uncharacterized protein n=1 Tax=Drechslerella stenobrocha 248 TaxID=1043628 RepID=W7HNP6_9PEZI|nr:hypothetical protein DRE_05257 [Drechslerella stenobrocha 248]